MTVPFRVEPEPGRRPAQQDPFLEFESERPSRSSLLGSQATPRTPEEILAQPVATPTVDRLPGERRTNSAINPSVAFALGVAGLVTAAVGYYQMGKLLADRSLPPSAAQIASSQNAGAPGATSTSPGRLDIASDPAGATVTVDGASRGVTPLSLADVAPGAHEVVISRDGAVVSRSVELAAGGTAGVTVVLTPPAPAPAAGNAPAAAAPAANAAAAPAAPTGWVTFDLPIELRVLDRGRPRGTTKGRVALSEGVHDLELVSDIYEVRQSISASVATGRGTRLSVPLPSGLVSINALPWADVWVDGNPVGTTPLANLRLPVGSHDVVFRHPTLGERRQGVIVKAVTPARLGIDYNR